MEVLKSNFIRRWHCTCRECQADSRDDGLMAPTKESLIDKIKDSDWYMKNRSTVYCPDCKPGGE